MEIRDYIKIKQDPYSNVIVSIEVLPTFPSIIEFTSAPVKTSSIENFFRDIKSEVRERLSH